MSNTDLKHARGGSTQEVSDKPVTPAGLYRHPQTGQEIITLYDPLFGDVQSEGFTRLGFEFVREADQGEVKSIVEQIIDTKSSESKDLQSIGTRLSVLEGVREENTAYAAENRELREKLAKLEKAETTQAAQDGPSAPASEVVDGSGDKAKEEAERQTASRGVDNTPAVDSGVTSPDPAAPAASTVEDEDEGKPFSQLNRAELEDLAKEEEIELPKEADTNAKIREAITKARAEKENK